MSYTILPTGPRLRLARLLMYHVVILALQYTSIFTKCDVCGLTLLRMAGGRFDLKGPRGGGVLNMHQAIRAITS